MTDLQSLVNETSQPQHLAPPEYPSGDDASSLNSTRSPRRWDDPPEEDPHAPPENTTTMVFLKGPALRSVLENEVMQLAFGANDRYLVALVPRLQNLRATRPDEPGTINIWALPSGQRVTQATTVRAHRTFAIRPGPELVVGYGHQESPSHAFQLEVRGFERTTRLCHQELPIQAPLAWSPDGTLLAAASSRDPSRAMVISFSKTNNVGKGADPEIARVALVVMKHTDHITHLSFSPDGTLLVSAARDSFVRVTDLRSGRTLRKIEVGTRHPAKMMEVTAIPGSPGELLVATVWGRDVVMWNSATGRVDNYNLNLARRDEGWPVAVSPDYRYLLCRTEEGFDVSECATGKFLGEFAMPGVVTAGCFNSDGTKLAVGTYNGQVQMFGVITAAESTQ